MSIRQYAPTPTKMKTLTRTDQHYYTSPSPTGTSMSSSSHYYHYQNNNNNNNDGYNLQSSSSYNNNNNNNPPRSNAESRGTNISNWGWASPSNSNNQQGRTPQPPSRNNHGSYNQQQYTPIRRHIKQQQGTQTPPTTRTTPTYHSNRQAEKHRKRMEKKSKRPGFKKDRVKTYGRVNKHHKQKRKIQYQPNDYIDFPRFIIAIEGPGNVENITKDVANYMGWYHICLEDLLIHCDDQLCQDAITNISQGLPVNLQSL